MLHVPRARDVPASRGDASSIASNDREQRFIAAQCLTSPWSTLLTPRRRNRKANTMTSAQTKAPAAASAIDSDEPLDEALSRDHEAREPGDSRETRDAREPRDTRELREPREPGALLEELLRDSPIHTIAEATLAPQATRSPAHEAPRAAQGGAALRTARIAELQGRDAKIAWRNGSDLIAAEVAPEIERELISDALTQRELVLVEVAEGATPVIVGVLQTRRPREIHLKAAVVHIEGEREVLLRSGRGAVRVREDGDIEIVGSRISAASRGLFRLVGRILRLN